MVNGDAILESLQAQMQESNKQFDEVNAEIEKTVKEYNDQIIALQTEGNKKLEELSKRREQIRGEYTGLYNMYMKFKSPETDNKKEVTESEAAKVVEMKPKAVKSKTTKKEDNALTAEEVAKLQSTIKKNNQPKEEDIPDYLKPEYNK